MSKTACPKPKHLKNVFIIIICFFVVVFCFSFFFLFFFVNSKHVYN